MICSPIITLHRQETHHLSLLVVQRFRIYPACPVLLTVSATIAAIKAAATGLAEAAAAINVGVAWDR